MEHHKNHPDINVEKFVKGELTIDETEEILKHLEQSRDIFLLMEIALVRHQLKIPFDEVPGIDRLRVLLQPVSAK